MPFGPLSWIMGLLFPRRCGGCGSGLPPKSLVDFCPGCLAALPWLAAPVCHKCGAPFASASPADRPRLARRMCRNCRGRRIPYSMARSAFAYSGPVRESIRAFKFRHRKSLADSFASLLERTRHEHPGLFSGVDFILPVPLHPKRLSARGYNQSALLARALGDRFAITEREDLLERRTDTPSQVGLGRPARRENMRGAFAVTMPQAVAGRHVLLVDDVMTTGATVEECALVLRRAGAREVAVLALARD